MIELYWTMFVITAIMLCFVVGDLFKLLLETLFKVKPAKTPDREHPWRKTQRPRR